QSAWRVTKRAGTAGPLPNNCDVALDADSRRDWIILRSRHVENQRTLNLGASGIEILEAGEEMVDGVLLFLRAAVTVGHESLADLVHRVEVLDCVPDVMSEIAIGTNLFHRETVS